MSLSRPIASILIVDIPDADHDLLRTLRLGHSRDSCWAPQKRALTGFSRLLQESAIDVIAHPVIVEDTPQPVQEAQSLEAYFSTFALKVNSALNRLKATPSNPALVVLNLMPFCQCTTITDKILTGLFSANGLQAKRPHDQILILLRNLDWVTKSVPFHSIERSAKFRWNVTVIDLRCFGLRYRRGLPPTPFQISRGAFQAILPCQEKQIYSALVFETNSHIGHFILPHSHVRTHYDLNTFIARDAVWEYLLAVVQESVQGAERILVLGVGMEYAALDKVGTQLKSSLGDRHVLEYDVISSPHSTSPLLVNWSTNYDLALVVTDIVNTGSTLQSHIRTLTAANEKQSPIRIFAIARMVNSPDTVEAIPIRAAVTIKRKHYRPDIDGCPLCELHQPAKRVRTVRDFQHVYPSQPTSFDFWEMVRDTDALILKGHDVQQRAFHYRVNTTKIIRQYRHWLKNVIYFKCKRTWHSLKPQALVTVAEGTGIQFASLVSEAIGAGSIVQVARDELRRVTPRGVAPEWATTTLARGSRVLLVDDGINYGHTMKALIGFCLAVGWEILGILVFDSRLDKQGIGPLEAMMGRRPVVAVYRWPARHQPL